MPAKVEGELGHELPVLDPSLLFMWNMLCGNSMEYVIAED